VFFKFLSFLCFFSRFYAFLRLFCAALRFLIQVLQKQMVVAQTFHKITGNEFHVIELCKIENMRFRQHGRGDIQRMANVREIFEKVRIRQLFRVFIYELFADSSVRH
jgi:hypothetical protein